jgi:DNA-binding XRE family transcriptional regulator
MQAKRIERGILQKQLAHKVGHTRQTITNWENGRSLPKWADMFRWCEALNVEILLYDRN